MKKTISTHLLATALIALPILGSGLLVGCSTTAHQESTGEYFDSSVITTKVKAKLLADDEVKSLPITVKTYKNVVQLSGFVKDYVQSARAVAIARSVEGVEDVKNSLIIRNR